MQKIDRCLSLLNQLTISMNSTKASLLISLNKSLILVSIIKTTIIELKKMRWENIKITISPTKILIQLLKFRKKKKASQNFHRRSQLLNLNTTENRTPTEWFKIIKQMVMKTDLTKEYLHKTIQILMHQCTVLRSLLKTAKIWEDTIQLFFRMVVLPSLSPPETLSAADSA